MFPLESCRWRHAEEYSQQLGSLTVSFCNGPTLQVQTPTPIIRVVNIPTANNSLNASQPITQVVASWILDSSMGPHFSVNRTEASKLFLLHLAYYKAQTWSLDANLRRQSHVNKFLLSHSGITSTVDFLSILISDCSSSGNSNRREYQINPVAQFLKYEDTNIILLTIINAVIFPFTDKSFHTRICSQEPGSEAQLQITVTFFHRIFTCTLCGLRVANLCNPSTC